MLTNASTNLITASFAAAVAWFAAAVAPAHASGNGSSDRQTCPAGQIWDANSGKCVSRQGSNLPDGDRTHYAYALAKAGRYTEALAMLDTLEQPATAEALNYHGYATRKLGRADKGIGYYLRSVAIDPGYAQVREYLGEAYVIKGHIDFARDQLRTIKGLCGTGCEEYRDLAEAIADPAGI